MTDKGKTKNTVNENLNNIYQYEYIRFKQIKRENKECTAYRSKAGNIWSHSAAGRKMLSRQILLDSECVSRGKDQSYFERGFIAWANMAGASATTVVNYTR